MRTRTTVAAAAAALLALTACGGNSDSPKASEASLKTAVKEYVSAFTGDDSDTAYDMLSQRCQDRTSRSDYEQTAALAHQLYGKLTPKTVEVKDLDGDTARVKAAIGVPALDEPDGDGAKWVREDGQWRMDKCDDEDASDAKADATPTPDPHDKDVKISKQGPETEYGETTYRVAFTVTNSGTEAANYWIEFEVYDTDGDFLGSTGSSVERLGPGKTKTDNVELFDVDNGKLADIDTVKVKKVEYCDGSDDDPTMCQI